MLVIVCALLFGCNSEQKQEPKEKKAETTTTGNATSKEAKYSDLTPQKPYELKEDGLYVYADGPDIKNKQDNKVCWEYIQKNYKYIRVSSQAANVKDDKRDIMGVCRVEKKCTTDLGKPSLFELGYERHKEREIKPEDNRFGVPIIVEKTWYENEKSLEYEYKIKYIDKSHFTKMTQQEFQNNGIVIIGKQISRVVIKKPVLLPFVYDQAKIPVEWTRTHYFCDGHSTKEEHVPVIMADFKRINLLENIFEFIEEDPLPKTASYLSDEQFVRLSENIHQFIPRTNDKTIHPKITAYFTPGYYLIEYYNGDQLLSYHCILIDGKGAHPPYWDPLKYDPPGKADLTIANEKYALIIAECKTQAEAEHIIKSKDPYPIIILPNSTQGNYLVGRLFYNKQAAENELKRMINMGLNKGQIRIVPVN